MDRNQTLKIILFWFFIILLGVFLWRMVSTPKESTPTMNYSEFLDQIDKNNVRELTIYPSAAAAEVRGHLRDSGAEFRTTIPKETISEVTRKLHEQKVAIEVKDETRSDWVTFLLNAAPLFLLVGFWIFMMRRMKSGKTGGPTP